MKTCTFQALSPAYLRVSKITRFLILFFVFLFFIKRRAGATLPKERYQTTILPIFAKKFYPETLHKLMMLLISDCEFFGRIRAKRQVIKLVVVCPSRPAISCRTTPHILSIHILYLYMYIYMYVHIHTCTYMCLKEFLEIHKQE